MGSKKAIIIASAIICILLLTILYMDYKIRNLEGEVEIPEQIDEINEVENTTIDLTDVEVNDTEAEEEVIEEEEEESSTEIGTLEIISYPAAAGVYLDDVKIGTTPYNNFSFPIGNHSIRIMKTNYGDYCKTAYVYKNTIEKITALMDSSKSIGCTGSSSISTSTNTSDDDEEEEEEILGTKFTSEPSGAELKISGQVKGTTPFSFELTEGTVLIKLSKDGYKTYSAFVNVGSDGFISSIDHDSEQNGNYTKESDDEYLFEIDK